MDQDPPRPHQRFDTDEISKALGGPLGIAESVVPSTAYLLVYLATSSDAKTAAFVALGLGALLTVARIARGQNPQFAISGLVGVGLSAFIVSRTGRAEDFFLPGLLLNAAYASGYAISNLVNWPLMGLIVSGITQQDTSWRKDPELLRRYKLASWVWAGLFLLRLIVQLPMYLADAVVALGIARVAMGIPLFVLGLWLSYLLLRDAARGPGAKTPSVS